MALIDALPPSEIRGMVVEILVGELYTKPGWDGYKNPKALTAASEAIVALFEDLYRGSNASR